MGSPATAPKVAPQEDPSHKEATQKDTAAATATKDPRLKSNPETKYPASIVSRQRFEAWILNIALVLALVFTFLLWQHAEALWCLVVLSGIGGTIGGLLHSLKWFYRTVGDGEWEWDRFWWRFMNPLVSGILGFSIYIVFRSGIIKNPAATPPGTEPFVAYSVGFLTGLFADNAMNKLRDVAHVLFGSTAPATSKPKPKPEVHPNG